MYFNLSFKTSINKLGPIFRVDYILPAKQRADKIVGVKTLVNAVWILKHHCKCLHVCIKQADLAFTRLNLYSVEITYFLILCYGDALWFAWGEVCWGRGRSFFSAPLSSWRLSRNEVSIGNMESCGECTCRHEISKDCMLFSDLDFTRQLGKHFFHFSFTQSESICQCGSTVQEKDLINSGISLKRGRL